MQTTWRNHQIQTAYVYLETLENTTKQRKESNKTWSAKMGGTQNLICKRICEGMQVIGYTASYKQQEISRIRTNLYVRLLRWKVCHLLSWLNRRVPNGTHGGVRGRGNLIFPPTRFSLLGNRCNVVVVNQELRSNSWSDCRWAITFLCLTNIDEPMKMG